MPKPKTEVLLQRELSFLPGWFGACPDKGEAMEAVVATAHHHAPSADHGRREDGRAQTRGAQRRAIASVEGMDRAVHRAHHGHACLVRDSARLLVAPMLTATGDAARCRAVTARRVRPDTARRVHCGGGVAVHLCGL